MIQWTEQDADMAGSQAAMLRAARRACELVKMHGHPNAISRNGKLVHDLTPSVSRTRSPSAV